MIAERIQALSLEKRLELRKNDITSTDVSCLFGQNPYKTIYQLWLEKAGYKQDDRVPSNYMQWGTALEEAIAKEIARERGWTIVSALWYDRDSTLRIGSSYDYFITGKEEAILEIKNVSEMSFKKGWTAIGDNEYEAPTHIELQVQHQLMVSGLKKAYIGVLVGGNKHYVIERNAIESVHQAIIQKVKEFWDSVERNIQPDPNYERDSALILDNIKTDLKNDTLFPSREDKLYQNIVKYRENKNKIGVLEEECNALKCKILLESNSFKKIDCGDIIVTISDVSGNEGTLITPEMIGQRYGARKPHRGIRVVEKKTSI
jgi:putative phage-type endonuclease